MPIIRAVLAFVLFTSLTAQAPSTAAAGPAGRGPAMQLVGGKWFDGERFVDAAWYVVDGRLTAVRPARVDVVVDLTGRYVLPPLADAHNHDAQNVRTATRSVDKNLGAGVFYSAQMCADQPRETDFRALLNRPGTLDLLVTGACISSSDGHPLGLAMRDAPDASPETLRASWTVIDSIADLDRLWPDIARRKPALIKLILVNSEHHAARRSDPSLFGFNGLDPKLVAPIVERAHSDGVRVVVHADSAADFEVAVAAGADLIGHLPGYRFAAGMAATDYRISDRSIAEAAKRGTIVITTAGVARYYLQARPADTAALQAVQIDNLQRLRRAGIPLAIGSDQFAGTAVDELLYLDALKVMPRPELLRRAVTDTPVIIFPDRKIGRFAEGMEASLIAFDANPIDDLEILRSPRLRIKQGSLLGAIDGG